MNYFYENADKKVVDKFIHIILPGQTRKTGFFNKIITSCTHGTVDIEALVR